MEHQKKKQSFAMRMKEINNELRLSVEQRKLTDYAVDIEFFNDVEEETLARNTKKETGDVSKKKKKNMHSAEDTSEFEMMYIQFCGAMNVIRNSWFFDPELATVVSHRPGLIGKICTFLRRLVRRASRWMVVPLSDRQSSFNRNVSDALFYLDRMVDALREEQQVYQELLGKNNEYRNAFAADDKGVLSDVDQSDDGEKAANGQLE